MKRGQSKMGRARYIACAVLLICPLAQSRHDDDFAFDSSDEFQVDLTEDELGKSNLRRLWGVPDTSAYAGHLFRMEIPKEAFSGTVAAYKVQREDGRNTPNWLAVDTKHGIISGLPEKRDIGSHTFTVSAHGYIRGQTITDSFTIEVKKANEKPYSKYGTCLGDNRRLILVILIDGAYHRIPVRRRISGLMQLSNFMALDGSEFWMEPYKHNDKSRGETILSGTGPTRRSHLNSSSATTGIYLNVGCGKKLWSKHKILVWGLREQARDGTLLNILKLPVIGWRVYISNDPVPRIKRQSPIEGSGGAVYDAEYDDQDDDGDNGDYSGYDENDENDDYTHNDVGSGPDAVEPLTTQTPHPHRHHHGESATPTTTDNFQTEAADTPTPPPTPTYPTLPSTQTETPTIPIEDTTEAEITTSLTTEDKVKITPYSVAASETSNYNISIVPASVKPRVADEFVFAPVTEASTTTEPDTQTVVIRASNELPAMTSERPVTSPAPPPTEPTTESTTSSTTSTTSTTARSTTTSTAPTTLPTSPPTVPPTLPPTLPPTTLPTTTPVPETTLQEVTKQEFTSPTEGRSTITGQTTETVTFAMPVNQPPTLKHHMKKLATIAGKAFRYIIPADLFTDPEEGSNLTFTMYEAENVPLSKNSWIQFIPTGREVYGLPLEAHVSRWNFIVEAQDSDGEVARGPLDITVQQHKSGRTINHQFILQFKLLKHYNNAIDWQIRALEGIVNLFRDTDMDHLTVLNATQKGDLCEFVWTNDTLPKDPACPMDDINRLMKIMESDKEPGSPSESLIRAMSPELKVGGVSWRGVGRCASAGAATRAPDTYPPVTRNQVDHLTATVGHLFIYKVPEDTFFDPEDGGTRNLALSLRYSDRTEIPDGNWLKFDAKNQEFYGLPLSTDEGSVNYQLIAEDSSKKSAYDSLIVEVVKAPTIRPTVEFQMTMEYPYTKLAHDANNKRKIVEKLATLFEQKEPYNIRIQSISNDPTTIIWYNTSLPMDRCPKKEIEELRRMIIADERGSNTGALRENVDNIFDLKELKVMSIRLIPLGLCAEQNTKQTKNIPVYAGSPSPANSKAGSATDNSYLITFIIPAVVIVCMILLAGIIASVLYRRRMTGKMSVGDEEERQAFRSKGIPVIFQDELEERGDTEPVHKSPVIMREEKPPLLPPAPDYRGERGGEDAPYRPPPPFTASRTPPRPKATPTYRKPPPYVPP